MEKSKTKVITARLIVLVIILAGWEFIPKLFKGSGIVILDPLFISSPSATAKDLWTIWSNGLVLSAIWSTLSASLLGLAIGVVLGYAVAVIFGEFKGVASIFIVYFDAINAIPRIALFPLIVILAGFGTISKVIGAVIVVFFIVFYNAFQGARSVSQETLDAYNIQGAGRWFKVRYIKAYVSFGWAVAQFPSAVAFSLVAVITTEILISNSGLGYLLVTATNLLDSSRVFSIIIVTAVVGVILSAGTRFLVRQVFPWSTHIA